MGNLLCLVSGAAFIAADAAAHTLFDGTYKVTKAFAAAHPPDEGDEFRVVTHGEWKYGALIYYKDTKLSFCNILAREGDDIHFVFRDEENNQYLVERSSTETTQREGAYNPTLQENHAVDGITASLQKEDLHLFMTKKEWEDIEKKPTSLRKAKPTLRQIKKT